MKILIIRNSYYAGRLPIADLLREYDVLVKEYAVSVFDHKKAVRNIPWVHVLTRKRGITSLVIRLLQSRSLRPELSSGGRKYSTCVFNNSASTISSAFKDVGEKVVSFG